MAEVGGVMVAVGGEEETWGWEDGGGGSSLGLAIADQMGFKESLVV